MNKIIKTLILDKWARPKFERVNCWVSTQFTDKVSKPKLPIKPIKNTEVPILDNYSKRPNEEFWEQFPKKDIPDSMENESPIDVAKFEQLYLSVKEKLNKYEIDLIEKVINDLKVGADACIDESLISSLNVENSKSMYNKSVGVGYTDQLCSWLKQGFVAGPFDKDKLPIENLRINQLFALEQKDKFRPILNLSYPPGNSFNEAVEKDKLPKVTMSSHKKIAKTITDAKGMATLSKIDHQSAYKLIPAKHDQLFLQGFAWLGKVFVELRMVFGSIGAVPSYDNFHEAYAILVRVIAETPKSQEERTLDDMMIIAKFKKLHDRFVSTYLSLAEDLNIPLASFEDGKAFINETEGTLLGVIYNGKDMTWMLPKDKIETYLFEIKTLRDKMILSLKDLQKINGITNFVTILCPDMKFYRNNLITEMKRAFNDGFVSLSCVARQTLDIWLNMIADTKFPMLIPINHDIVDQQMITFYTATATSVENEGGVACSHYELNGEVKDNMAFAKITTELLNSAKSLPAKHRYSLLHTLAWVLPITSYPEICFGKKVLIECDNTNAIFNWMRGRSRHCSLTSTLLTAIHELTLFLECKLIVRHRSKNTSTSSMFTEILTHGTPSNIYILDLKSKNVKTGWTRALNDWIKNPELSENLGRLIIMDLKLLMKNP